MQLGHVGLWTFQLDLQPASAAQEAAAELEELGYPTVWVPEAVGREPFVNAACCCRPPGTLTVATGHRQRLGPRRDDDGGRPADPGRGLPGSVPPRPGRQPPADGRLRPGPPLRQAAHARCAATSRRWTTSSTWRPAPRRSPAGCSPRSGRRCSSWRRPRPSAPTPTSCPSSTRRSRGRCSATGPMLCPEQAVVLATDPEVGRAAARQHMATYLGLPNYTNNLRRLGWGDDDLADGGSDALVDAIVAWGDEERHRRAGAGAPRRRGRPRVRPGARRDATALPMPQWRALAPALGSLA